MLYEGLDIYQAKIEDETDGIFAISLVDFPAVEKNFICFKDEKKQMKFSIDSDEKRNITGVVMLADTPIYRRNGDYEYYITYSKETIEKMANKLLKDGFQNRVDLMHDGELITGISMMELYIKDSSKGINPSFISDIPDGSLMATFHVEDEKLWDEIKNGDVLNGFSLEGLFTIEKMHNNKIKNNSTMSKITKFIKSLMKFGEISTDKGTIYWDGEGDIAVDVEVYVDGEDDTKVIAEDGEYVIEDGRTIVIVDGKVSEIREKEGEETTEETTEEVIVEAAEEVVVEEPVVDEPQPDERDEDKERIDRLEGEIEALKGEIEVLKGEIAKIITEPAATPIVEEFEAVNTVKTKGNKAAKLFSNLNK